MNKKAIYIAVSVYSFFLIFSGFFLISYLFAFIETGDMFPLFLILFNSFVLGYCGMRLAKWYKKWLLYKKYGVKGTWEN